VKSKRSMLWFLIALVTALLALTAVACGGDDDEGDGEQAATETQAEEPISVAFVTDTAGADDSGFNEFSINGVERAEQELGITKRIYISKAAEDYVPNLTAAAEDGHDLVIAAGFLIAPSVIEVAEAFPDTNFAGVDHFYGGDGCAKAKTCAQPNALGLQYPSEEPGYVAGVVAALMTKTGTVSTVGGEKIPSVDNWIAGFQQGVIDTKPGTKTLNAYSDDFQDQAKCKEIALDHIGQRADVVFQVAGLCGLGAIDAACEKNLIAIGVDADQSGAGKCVLFSALKPLETSVFELIETAQQGNFKGGRNQTFGVADLPDAQLLTDFTKPVPQNVQDAAKEADEKVKSGEIDPPATLAQVKR
jgi:basic membrane protein A and related proteins